MASDKIKLKLPEHLCEAQDPLSMAKAYTLQLLLLAGRVDEQDQIAEWISMIEPTKILTIVREYERCQKLAEEVIPFIRSDLIALVQKFDCGYKSSSNDTKDLIVETDGFLYEDLDEALESLSIMSDRICGDCKSPNVTEMNMTLSSHTVDSLINLFTIVLNDDLSSKTVAIVGSGLGALVYSTFLFSNASNILSYENEKLCKVQKLIVQKYGMEPRVKLHPMTLCLQPSFTQDVDVLIINTCMDKNILEKSFESRLNFKKDAIILYYSKNGHSYVFPSVNFLVKIESPPFSPQEFHIYKVV